MPSWNWLPWERIDGLIPETFARLLINYGPPMMALRLTCTDAHTPLRTNTQVAVSLSVITHWKNLGLGGVLEIKLSKASSVSCMILWLCGLLVIAVVASIFKNRLEILWGICISEPNLVSVYQSPAHFSQHNLLPENFIVFSHAVVMQVSLFSI